jgi:hypothetical protein
VVVDHVLEETPPSGSGSNVVVTIASSSPVSMITARCGGSNSRTSAATCPRTAMNRMTVV